jgi:hypothetical protein
MPVVAGRLTAKREAYARARAVGATVVAAYERHFDPRSSNPLTLKRSALRLEALPQVRARVVELRDEAGAELAQAIVYEYAMRELHAVLATCIESSEHHTWLGVLTLWLACGGPEKRTLAAARHGTGRAQGDA